MGDIFTDSAYDRCAQCGKKYRWEFGHDCAKKPTKEKKVAKAKKPCHKFECGPTAMYEQYCVNCGFEDKQHVSIEEWGQTEYDEGKKAGIEEGKALLIKKIQQISADAYQDEEDEKADLLRELAKTLKKL